MYCTKAFLLLFLGSALVLADSNQDLSVSDGSDSWFARWKNTLNHALKETYDEEKSSLGNALNKVKTAVGNIAAATVDTAKASLDFSLIAPKIGLNILTGNDTKEAIKKPFRQSKESIKNAFGSMKNAVTGSLSAGAGVAKASWDLSFIVPKFGLNLLPEQKAKLETALRQTYDEEKESVDKAVQSILEAASEMAGIGQELIETSWDVAVSLPTIANQILLDKSKDDKLLKDKLAQVEQGALYAVRLVEHAGKMLANVGIDVAKAGFDLSMVIPKYGLNLMNDNERKELESLIQMRVNNINKSINSALSSVDEVVKKIDNATATATAAGYDLGKLLPKLDKEVLDKSKQEFRQILDESLKKASLAVNKALDSIKVAGRKVSASGKNLINASIELARAIPKFGFGLLGDQRELFGEQVRETFRKQKESVEQVIEAIKEAGKTIVDAGKQVFKSSWDVVRVIPKFGLQALGIGKEKPQLEAEQKWPVDLNTTLAVLDKVKDNLEFNSDL